LLNANIALFISITPFVAPIYTTPRPMIAVPYDLISSVSIESTKTFNPLADKIIAGARTEPNLSPKSPTELENWSIDPGKVFA